MLIIIEFSLSQALEHDWHKAIFALSDYVLALALLHFSRFNLAQVGPELQNSLRLFKRISA